MACAGGGDSARRGCSSVSRAGTVLMQHRAAWTNAGGTWALPGGARDSHETAREAALREAQEETGIDVDQVRVVSEVVTTRVDGWTYTTVIGRCDDELEVTPNAESEELAWVNVNNLKKLPLLSPFANSLPILIQRGMHEG